MPACGTDNVESKPLTSASYYFTPSCTNYRLRMGKTGSDVSHFPNTNPQKLRWCRGRLFKRCFDRGDSSSATLSVVFALLSVEPLGLIPGPCPYIFLFCTLVSSNVFWVLSFWHTTRCIGVLILDFLDVEFSRQLDTDATSCDVTE